MLPFDLPFAFAFLSFFERGAVVVAVAGDVKAKVEVGAVAEVNADGIALGLRLAELVGGPEG